MKSYHSLAWKELKAQKVTSILILIAIVLSTMMTTVIGQSLGILGALREQQAGMLNGYRYATFQNVTEHQRNILSDDKRLSWVGSNIYLGTADMLNSGMSLQLREYDEKGLSAYPTISQIQKGRLPQNAREIALPEDALSFLGITAEIDDTIKLDLRISLINDSQADYEYQAEFTLCGILKSNYLGYSSGLITGIAGQGSAEKLLSEKYLLYTTDFRTTDKKNFQQTVYDLAEKIGIGDKHIQYNWVYLNALGISYETDSNSISENNGFSYMAACGVMIGALVLLAAGLVIYNILKIAVGKRIRQYGTLRAIGAEQGHLYRLVAEQLILLCGIGIPLGALFGVLSASGITKAATSLFSPSIFMVQSTEELSSLITQNSTGKLFPLLISVVITLVFAFVAAMPAARYASKVSPTVAMRGTSIKVRRKKRRDKSIRHFEPFYARLNLKRNAGRTFITILSLVMSITVFVALGAFSRLLDTSRDVQNLHLGDYSITNDIIGFEPSVVEDLKEQSGISYVSTLKYSLYTQDSNSTLPISIGFALQPGEAFHIVGVDEERLQSLVPSLTENDMYNLKGGKACLIKNPISMTIEGQPSITTSFTAGDTIIVSNTELKVIGNCPVVGLDNDGFVNGVQVVVFDTVYDQLTGKNTYSELYPLLTDGVDRLVIEQKIEEITNQTSGSYWLSYENTDKQLKESYQQIKLLAWGLIIFIGLIGLLNIINTTYTNIHTRMNEIGMQRAVGMSKVSMYKTYLWEGAYYSIIATVIGAIAGYVCTIFVEAAVTNQLAFSAVPIFTILQAAFTSIIACLIATFIPLHQITKMSIVDSIETVE